MTEVSRTFLICLIIAKKQNITLSRPTSGFQILMPNIIQMNKFFYHTQPFLNLRIVFSEDNTKDTNTSLTSFKFTEESNLKRK